MDRKFFGKTNNEWGTYAIIVVITLGGLFGVSWALSRWLRAFNTIEIALLIVVVVGAAIVLTRRHHHHEEVSTPTLPSDSDQPFASSLGVAWKEQTMQDPTEEILPLTAPEQKPPMSSPDLVVPDDYYSLRHWKNCTKKLVPYTLLFFVCLVLFAGTIYVGSKVSADYGRFVTYFLLALVCTMGVLVLLSYRCYWAWKHHPLTASTEDGMLNENQDGNPWLVMPGSDADAHPLDELNIETPKQTVWETYLFKSSQTLILSRGSGDKKHVVAVFHDFKNAKAIREIQSYRKQIDLHYSRRSVEIQEKTYEAILELNRFYKANLNHPEQ